jgi:hypothetical protein
LVKNKIYDKALYYLCCWLHVFAVNGHRSVIKEIKEEEKEIKDLFWKYVGLYSKLLCIFRSSSKYWSVDPVDLLRTKAPVHSLGYSLLIQSLSHSVTRRSRQARTQLHSLTQITFCRSFETSFRRNRYLIFGALAKWPFSKTRLDVLSLLNDWSRNAGEYPSMKSTLQEVFCSVESIIIYSFFYIRYSDW